MIVRSAAESRDALFCGLVSEEADKRPVFRLRYEVYVEEQGKPYPEADHDEHLLFDELDRDAEIVLVRDGDLVVGTVRSNWLDSIAALNRFGTLFEIRAFAEVDPSRMAVCSRLAVVPGYRKSRVRSLLFETIYRRGLLRGTKLCFATCAPPLVRLFSAYGFREYATPVSDATVGLLHRMVLVLGDIAHLQRVRSPLLPLALERGAGDRSAPLISTFMDSRDIARTENGA